MNVCLCVGFFVTLCPNQIFGESADQPPVNDDCRTLVATVFGRQIYADDPRAKRLFDEISWSAVQEYSRAKKLSPTKEQLAKIFSDTIAKHPELMEDDEAKRNTAMRLFWLQGASLDWITAKALHEEYGGPIAISSFGAYTSITGRDAIIGQFIKSGDIQFHQCKAEKEFHERLQSQRVLDVTIRDLKRIKQMFAVSPWQRWIQELDRRPEESNPATAAE